MNTVFVNENKYYDKHKHTIDILANNYENKIVIN